MLVSVEEGAAPCDTLMSKTLKRRMLAAGQASVIKDFSELVKVACCPDAEKTAIAIFPLLVGASAPELAPRER
jgi:hypothetical protein